MGTRTGSSIALDQTLSQKERGWPRETTLDADQTVYFAVYPISAGKKPISVDEGVATQHHDSSLINPKLKLTEVLIRPHYRRITTQPFIRNERFPISWANVSAATASRLLAPDMRLPNPIQSGHLHCSSVCVEFRGHTPYHPRSM